MVIWEMSGEMSDAAIASDRWIERHPHVEVLRDPFELARDILFFPPGADVPPGLQRFRAEVRSTLILMREMLGSEVVTGSASEHPPAGSDAGGVSKQLAAKRWPKKRDHRRHVWILRLAEITKLGWETGRP